MLISRKVLWGESIFFATRHRAHQRLMKKAYIILLDGCKESAHVEVKALIDLGL